MAGSFLAGVAAAAPAVAHTSALYPTQYTLTVRNESTSYEQFAVYQTDPGISVAAVPLTSYEQFAVYQTTDLGVSVAAVPLVWQDVRMKANAETGLSWNSDYSLSWSNSADLKPGSVYHPDQTLPVSPGVAREDGAELTDTHGVLGMHRASPPKQAAGTLSLEELSTVPTGGVSVALGMSGRPASVLKAEPNQTLYFTPHPNYWIKAGTFTEGEVINPRTGSEPLRLNFGTKGAITVTFHKGGRWTVS
jgi:hypothetical protein